MNHCTEQWKGSEAAVTIEKLSDSTDGIDISAERIDDVA